MPTINTHRTYMRDEQPKQLSYAFLARGQVMIQGEDADVWVARLGSNIFPSVRELDLKLNGQFRCKPGPVPCVGFSPKVW